MITRDYLQQAILTGWWKWIELHLTVRITEDNTAATGQFQWEPRCFSVTVRCHLPGLPPWGLACAVDVGPGLFPARLRRSSACACAAAAVCGENTRHRQLESRHVEPDKAGLSSNIKEYFPQACSQRPNRFDATEQSSYSTIRHKLSLKIHPAANHTHTRISVTSGEGRAAERETAVWSRTLLSFLVNDMQKNSIDCRN